MFEDFSSPGVTVPTRSSEPSSSSPPASYSPPAQRQEPPSTVTPSTFPEDNSQSTSSTIPASTISSGSPLFVVSKSIISSILPMLIYIIFIYFFIGTGGFNITSIIIIAIFIAIIVLPILFTPRKYEFFDSSLRIHKIVGGDTEIMYSDLTLYENPRSRRPQIVLLASGQRRPIVVGGNPTNEELGQTLDQFLQKKVKKYNPKEQEEQQQEKTTEDEVDSVSSTETDTSTESGV